MSRGPHQTIEMPPNWWAVLEDECRAMGIETVGQLCERKPGILSARTIRNAQRNGWMTEGSFQKLANLLDYPTSHDLKDAWNKAANQKAGSSREGMPNGWSIRPKTRKTGP